MAENRLKEVTKAAELFLYHFVHQIFGSASYKWRNLVSERRITYETNWKTQPLLGFRTTLSLPGKVDINIFLTIFMSFQTKIKKQRTFASKSIKTLRKCKQSPHQNKPLLRMTSGKIHDRNWHIACLFLILKKINESEWNASFFLKKCTKNWAIVSF